MVLKVRPDPLVESGTRLQSASIILQNQKLQKKHKKLETAGSTKITRNWDSLISFRTVQLGYQNIVIFGKIEAPCL